MNQIKRSPVAVNDRASKTRNVCHNDYGSFNSTELLEIQANRVQQRYRVSRAVARVTAELAFGGGRGL